MIAVPPPRPRFPADQPLMTPTLLYLAHLAFARGQEFQITSLCHVTALSRAQLGDYVAQHPAPDIEPILDAASAKWSNPRRTAGKAGPDYPDFSALDVSIIGPHCGAISSASCSLGLASDRRSWADAHAEGPAAVEDLFSRRLLHARNEHAQTLVSLPRPDLLDLTDLQPQPLRWLFQGRIPLGKLTALIGPPGIGKSLIALDLAARFSRGDAWPLTSRDYSGGEGAVARVNPTPPALPSALSPTSSFILHTSSLQPSPGATGGTPGVSASACATVNPNAPTPPGATGGLPASACATSNPNPPPSPRASASHSSHPTSNITHQTSSPADSDRINRSTACRERSRTDQRPAVSAVERLNGPAAAAGHVLFLCPPNDLHDTFLPRFLAAAGTVPISARGNGDCPVSPLSRITFLTRVHAGHNPNDPAPPKAYTPAGPARFNLATDLPALEAAIAQRPNLKLIIIDSLTDFLRGHAVRDAYALLESLADLARIRGVAILITARPPRQGGGVAAKALLDLAPVTWSLCNDPFPPGARAATPASEVPAASAAPASSSPSTVPCQLSTDPYLLLPRHNNLAPPQPGFAFTIASAGCGAGSQPAPAVSSPTSAFSLPPSALPRIHWSPHPLAPSDPRVLTNGRVGRPSIQLHLAQKLLLSVLASGPRPANDLIALAAQHDISDRTLYRAARALGLDTDRPGAHAHRIWSLPSRDNSQPARIGEPAPVATAALPGATGGTPGVPASAGVTENTPSPLPPASAASNSEHPTSNIEHHPSTIVSQPAKIGAPTPDPSPSTPGRE